MTIDPCITVGENVYGTRVLKVDGQSVKSTADCGHAIIYKPVTKGVSCRFRKCSKNKRIVNMTRSSIARWQSGKANGNGSRKKESGKHYLYGVAFNSALLWTQQYLQYQTLLGELGIFS